MTPAAARIAAEIEEHGPIAFSRFMDIALYDPGCGYYRSLRDPFGPNGDFYTASQLQPVFGRLVATALADLHRELGDGPDFTVVEWGAGRSDLAPALAGFNYRAVDSGRGSPLEDYTGVAFANELFDALPVDVLRRSNGEWRDMRVGRVGDGFGWVEGPAVDFPEEAPEGRWREVAVRMRATLNTMAAPLRRGFVLVIDYGYTVAELRRFPQGSLMAYRRHQPLDDIFARPGEQDLTAHVDWDALHACASDAGLTLVRFETLAHWLLRIGEPDHFARALAARSEAESVRHREQLKTLLFSMGETFRVALWQKDPQK